MLRRSASRPCDSAATNYEVLPLADAAPPLQLDDLLTLEPNESPQATARPTSALPNVVVGVIAGLTENGDPLVDFADNSTGGPLAARSTARVATSDVGHRVALLFEGADLRRPIVLGLIRHTAATGEPVAQPVGPSAVQVEATADGERVVIAADTEIELRCGKSSITLTRAGKVLIRGAYLLSRSSGVNRIKGGSVQIN
jgi:hypothetical protein